MRYTFLILIIATTIAGCKKKITTPAPVEEEGNATLTVNNSLQDSVFIDISGHDIATGTQPHIFSIALAPESTVTIPRADLKSDYKYYYTWHTKDYTYSSWYHTTAAGYPTDLSFDYYTDTTDYVVNISGQQRNELKVFLDNDAVSTLWTAVDAYDNTGTSIWSSLTDSAKNHRFTITKYHTVKHTFTKLASSEASNTLYFSLPKMDGYVSLAVEQETDNFLLTQNASPHVNLSTPANDTLYYIYRKNGSYIAPFYKLARVKVTR